MDYIYIVKNEAMPDLIKIGFTGRDYVTRLSELSNTSVPFRFELLALFQVQQGKVCEQAMHEALARYRVDKDREFFKVSISTVLTLTADILASFSGSEIKRQRDDLDDLDHNYLYWICNGNHGQKNPTHISDQYGEDIQYTISRLYRLSRMGLIKEHSSEEPEWAIWTITHAGREYVHDENRSEQ